MREAGVARLHLVAAPGADHRDVRDLTGSAGLDEVGLEAVLQLDQPVVVGEDPLVLLRSRWHGERQQGDQSR